MKQWRQLVSVVVAASAIVTACTSDDDASAVNLSDVDDSVVAACGSAAKQLGFTVGCPSQLPTGTIASCPNSGPRADCVWGDGFTMEPTLPVATGVTEAPFHLILESAKTGRSCEAGGSSSDAAAVRGIDAVLFHCSEVEGLLAGHVMVRWPEDGVVFSVSVHGQGDGAVQLIFEIAEQITPVPSS